MTKRLVPLSSLCDTDRYIGVIGVKVHTTLMGLLLSRRTGRHESQRPPLSTMVLCSYEVGLWPNRERQHRWGDETAFCSSDTDIRKV